MWRRGVPGLALALALGACAGPDHAPGLTGAAYLWQAAAGQFELVWRAEPVRRLIDDPATDPQLRERLALALEIRAFAVRELALPDNDSYTRYVALDRPFVVWNVFAAPPLSLKLRESCFPVAGCVGYRGYFSQAGAEAWAKQARAEGYEAFVAGVPAYSTLGWFDDPLLSSFLGRDELELARLIFHELAHQKLYVKGDTTFNESYATVVERVGLHRWLDARLAAGADPALRERWARRATHRNDFLGLLRAYRARLEALFALPIDEAEKFAARERLFDRLRAEYADLRAAWGGFAGYDRWFAQRLTTAQLASIAAYDDLTPAFERLLDAQGGDIAAFHEAARRLSRLPPAERRDALAILSGKSPRDPGKMHSEGVIDSRKAASPRRQARSSHEDRHNSGDEAQPGSGDETETGTTWRTASSGSG